MNGLNVKREWISIVARRPDKGQEVWYWFEIPKRVYAGKYDKEADPLTGDVFHGASGFLTDDVTWWMPRSEGDFAPPPPSLVERARCQFHSDDIGAELDDDDWSTMVRKSSRQRKEPPKSKIKRKTLFSQ